MEMGLGNEVALTVEPGAAAVETPEPLVSPRLAGEALPHLRQVSIQTGPFRVSWLDGCCVLHTHCGSLS